MAPDEPVSNADQIAILIANLASPEPITREQSREKLGYHPVLSVKVPEWLGRAWAWLEGQVAFSGLPFFALFHQ